MSDQIKEDDMGWACGIYGKEKSFIQGFGEETGRT
jgi:hypothetical protein